MTAHELAQLYASGEAGAALVRQIEEHVEEVLEEQREAAQEKIDNADIDCIFNQDRSEEFDVLLDRLKEVTEGMRGWRRDDLKTLYADLVKLQTEILSAQAHADTMIKEIFS